MGMNGAKAIGLGLWFDGRPFPYSSAAGRAVCELRVRFRPYDQGGVSRILVNIWSCVPTDLQLYFQTYVQNESVWKTCHQVGSPPIGVKSKISMVGQITREVEMMGDHRLAHANC